MKEREADPSVVETVRRWAQATTPDELKKRGVSRVRSINLQRMSFMIEKAVNRALLARTIGGLEGDQEDISALTRDEFMRLVHSDSQSSTIEEQAESELERLKRELRDRRRTVREHEQALERAKVVPTRGEDELTRKIRALFKRLGDVRKGRLLRLEEDLIALTTSELRDQRGRAERQRLSEHKREMERLERRVGKLSALLGETERELARLAQAKSIDPGVASIYRSVQGLSANELETKRKEELLLAVFEANVELRRTVSKA